MWMRETEKLKKDEDCQRVFLKQNKPFSAGELHFQPELAKTMREIAKNEEKVFIMAKLLKILLKS